MKWMRLNITKIASQTQSFTTEIPFNTSADYVRQFIRPLLGPEVVEGGGWSGVVKA